MDLDAFLALLLVCSAITSMITEHFKSDKRSPNVVATITGLLVGVLVGFGFVVLRQLVVTDHIVVTIIMLGIGSGLGAMIGYDKVTQAITQICTIAKNNLASQNKITKDEEKE